MDELLKYTRLVFEVRYLNEACEFECVWNEAESGFCRCICIPGVAVNYIFKVAEYCLEGIGCRPVILWDRKLSRFVVRCVDDTGRFIAKDFKADQKCILQKEICDRAPNTEFSYLQIRPREELNLVYSSSNFNKIIVNKRELDNNGKDYLKLFAIVAKEFAVKLGDKEYLDMLFRLFFFLFPEACEDIMLQILESIRADEELDAYSRKCLEDYYKLGNAVPESFQITDTFKILREYLGIDFKDIYKCYIESKDLGDVRELKELVRNRLNMASTLRGSFMELNRRVGYVLEEKDGRI